MVGNLQFICRWLLFKCERSQLELLGPLAGLEPAWLNYRIPPPAAASCARVPGACPCSPWPPLRPPSRRAMRSPSAGRTTFCRW
ncbi:hypothetical protein ACFPRL_24245 [Pseudoclavibacter helvolus]